jgi:hypothetical protein
MTGGLKGNPLLANLAKQHQKGQRESATNAVAPAPPVKDEYAEDKETLNALTLILGDEALFKQVWALGHRCHTASFSDNVSLLNVPLLLSYCPLRSVPCSNIHTQLMR